MSIPGSDGFICKYLSCVSLSYVQYACSFAVFVLIQLRHRISAFCSLCPRLTCCYVWLYNYSVVIIIIITFISGNKAHMTEKTHNETKTKKNKKVHTMT